MGAFLETALSQPRAAVAGCGAISATGAGIGTLAGALRDNRSALRAREAFAGKHYQTTVAGWVPEETIAQLAARDPGHADARAFLMADAALREAGKNLPTVAAGRRALVLSTTKADIAAMERVFHRQPCSKTAHRHILPRLLADDLAEAHQARGPVQCISAGCISGLLALQQGASLIERGAADVALVAGVDLVSHFVLAGFTSLKSLDTEGCRPFDSRRTGLSLGDGAGAVALARRDLLPSPVWTIAAWGSSNDANHLTGPSRDGSGLALAITRALQRAAVATDEIDYLNAHGTGTPYNDNMESLALRAVFGRNVPPCSSSKGMLGHTLGAAGVLETILCLLAARSGTLPGTPRLRERDPVAPQTMLLRPQPATQLRCILKINSGFGGANAALVLRKDPA
jgi:3-oxoacyl-(acyl-carrier-protein) synthase